MKRNDLRSRGLISGAILSAVVGLAAFPAAADVSLFDHEGLKIDGAFVGGITGFVSPGAQFKTGTWTNNGQGAIGRRITGHPAWTETFLHPELKASYETEKAGTFYGDVSAELTMTGGDGDASLLSTTYGHPLLIDIENGYGGWKSGKVLEGLGLDENALDLSGGRQSFRVADGFLISNGVFNAGQRGMFWTQSRTAFSQTGLAKVATGPIRGDVFYLQNETAQHKLSPSLDFAKTKVFGGNVEWFETVAAEEGKPAKDGASNFADRKWYAGLTFFHVLDAKASGPFSFASSEVSRGALTNLNITNTLTSNRDGMNVFSAHVGGNFLPFAEDFSLYGNYVYESNGKAGYKVSANAWYLEPGYQLSTVPWTPKLSYRYAHFSGDGNPNDTTKKAYDPYFYNAITRGFGTWFIGEIVGNYVISNSNVNINQLVMSVNPRDDLKLSVLGYIYNYDNKNQFVGVGGAAITSDSLAHEIDFTAEWTITDNVSLSGALGIARSGSGYKQYLNTYGGVAAGTPNSGTWYLGETSVVVKF